MPICLTSDSTKTQNYDNFLMEKFSKEKNLSQKMILESNSGVKPDKGQFCKAEQRFFLWDEGIEFHNSEEIFQVGEGKIFECLDTKIMGMQIGGQGSTLCGLVSSEEAEKGPGEIPTDQEIQVIIKLKECRYEN